MKDSRWWYRFLPRRRCTVPTLTHCIRYAVRQTKRAALVQDTEALDWWQQEVRRLSDFQQDSR